MTRPTEPAEALVHDLVNMLALHDAGRATAEQVAFAAGGIVDNYRLATEGEGTG